MKPEAPQPQDNMGCTCFSSGYEEDCPRHKPVPAQSPRCPTCDSPNPKLHPAMQADGGEVQICRNAWHGPVAAQPEPEAARPMACFNCGGTKESPLYGCIQPWHDAAPSESVAPQKENKNGTISRSSDSGDSDDSLRAMDNKNQRSMAEVAQPTPPQVDPKDALAEGFGQWMNYWRRHGLPDSWLLDKLAGFMAAAESERHRENGRLRDTIAHLAAYKEPLKSEVARLTAENQRLTREVERLKTAKGSMGEIRGHDCGGANTRASGEPLGETKS